MNLRLTLAFVLASVISGHAYGKEFPLTASASVPAATGKVNIGHDSNGNTKVKVEAEHLAEPGKLSPPANDYIVWFQERGAEPISQGRLKVEKNLKGKFSTSTPLKNFDVFVTAEPDVNTKQPSGTEVLRATVQQ